MRFMIKWWEEKNIEVIELELRQEKSLKKKHPTKSTSLSGPKNWPRNITECDNKNDKEKQTYIYIDHIQAIGS